MCHISPWPCTVGLCKGAGHVLQEGGYLMIYGPFKVDGQCTTQSNADFDASLRQRDPEWGYRDVADIQAEAAKSHLSLLRKVEMPANNLYLVFQKSTSQLCLSAP
eukprot:TRINITY_DN11466_c0_g1_i1.p3 TRINITY_DN11466_c0_g1~~TRINITY_DN11466_c0_g1_i1.p3  ORF type:complete len:105 (+),score=3.29 TRINITY_DN11466_c0_g1_i1:1-315(+)